MTTWTEDELDRIGRANELQIATARKDGSVPPSIPIWAVRVGDDIVVRSARGAAIDAAYREKFGVNIYSDGVTTDASAASTLVVAPA